MEGISNHSPFFLEIKGASQKYASPFKMNLDWLKEDEFLALIQQHWKDFDP